MVDYSLNRATLKSKPVSISERNYLNLNDTIFTDTLTGKLNDSWTSDFDKEGNIVSVKIFFDSNFYFYKLYTFNEDGEQYEFNSYSKKDTTKRSFLKSKKIAEGKYKRETYDADKITYTEIWTFADGGQRMTRERLANDTISFTENEFYEKGLLKKITHNERSRLSDRFFYYAKNHYLDSETVFINKIPVTKYFYVNNEYGDPVYYERSAAGVVEQRRWMKYEYDEKGNWIKMIEKEEDAEADLIMLNTWEKYPGYRLIVRDIKY